MLNLNGLSNTEFWNGYFMQVNHLNIKFFKVIYVLRIYVDPKETIAFICSASEFLIPFSILSFGIVDAGTRHCKDNTYGIDQGIGK